jgi:peptidoglycan hydrolase FlgJ
LDLPPIPPAIPVQAAPLAPLSGASAPGAARPASDAQLLEAAQQFETAFLAEMLKQSGINAVSSEFGGGEGEDAFASLLTQEYARLLSESGGIGLAEQIFESLKQRTSER